MNSLRENIIRYGTFILVFLTPLVFLSHRLYPHISTKTFFIYGVVEVLFFVWMYTIIVDRSYRLSKKVLKYFLPLIFFVLWMSLSGIVAMNPHLSFWSSFARGTGLLTLYHCLALSFVTASLVKKFGMPYIISLFEYFIAGSFVLALSVWLGADGLHLPFTVLKTDAGGGFAGNSTLTATYFLFALAMSLFLLCTKDISKTKKWFIYTTIATIIFSPVFASLYGLFSGGSILGTARGTILALISGIGASVLGFMFLSSKKTIKRLSIGITTTAVIIFGFLWVQLLTPNTKLHNTFAEQARDSRFIFWDVAQKAMDERPLLGYGPENYAIAYQKYFNPNILVAENNFEGWNDKAHNIYYELGSTAGYPAIGIYLLFFLSLFYGVYRLYKQTHVNRAQASIVVGLFVAYIVNNLFTFDSNISLMSLFILVGIVYSSDRHNIKQKLHSVQIEELNKNVIAVLMFSVLIICLIFFVHMPSQKSKLYAETFASAINKRPSMYPELLKGSSMGRDWDASGLAFDIYKKYSANPASIKSDPKIVPYAIEDITALGEYLSVLTQNNKTDYRLYISIAFLQNNLSYLTDKSYDENTSNRILENLNYAQLLSPTNPNVYWSIAQTKIWGGDLKGVETAYRQAIQVAPDIATPYNLFLMYAQIVGNQKLFDEVLTQAQTRIPGYVFKK